VALGGGGEGGGEVLGGCEGGGDAAGRVELGLGV
jgi:hypothetical protein